METYTEMADQLERQAEEIVPVDARPYTSCYEALNFLVILFNGNFWNHGNCV